MSSARGALLVILLSVVPGAAGAQAPSDAAPAPARVAEPSLLKRIATDFATFPLRKSTWVLVGAGVAGAAAVHPADDTFNARLAGADAFFAPGAWAGKAWVQTVAAAGLYSAGRFLGPRDEQGARSNRATRIGIDLLRAQLLAQGISRATRYSLRRERPTGGCCSLPSGHAINAFAAASVVERHVGHRGAWPTMAVASYVAISRLHENTHYLSDVVLGSAIGLSIGWTIVRREDRAAVSVQPMPGGLFVSVATP
jgi:membrane-associated phospholipid phosphatase